ncbi:cell wall metabolism sensor histidine kinase VicK [Streptococcus sp. sy010]|uniref:cell wall metabolism sensor histidine kinase VicK n=1 Tax=Streptococcus sp. sy010 TaxID=2600148 RepID=UPI0011B389EE|nr:cell wall metabolism sensor histidine kinase VicK [Streptococcus sp. sy010]TWT16624.1 cell wall metabolism sensor histidine kinase VicK [Streptococcus sp. sy010]
MNDTNLVINNLTQFELALLFLLSFVAFYFIWLAIRDYRHAQNVKSLNIKVKQMISGDYSDTLPEIKGDHEMVDLANHLNDLSNVLSYTHDSLAQERNRLASVLAYMTDGVLATNRTGRIIMINATAEKYLNISREKAFDLSILDILGRDNPYSYQDLITKTPEVVLNSRDENGEFITLRIRFALNRKENGFVSGLIAVLHDTTNLEKEERERRMFVSNVSHELRTPLTSVKSYLEALDDGALNEPVAPEFIKVSLDETNRMMRMISDLLNLSRIDNKANQLNVEMTNFTAFVTAILNRFEQIKNQNNSDGKRFEIIRDYPLNPAWLEIDTDKMTQVLDNLLNNAIKYSPDGGQIIVTMATSENRLMLSITDQGLGIPKKDLPLIFDRFYRVDKARSRAQGGTGLGLSIAKEIIKQHKGFIWAKSQEGKGSTFNIILPYEKAQTSFEEWEDVELD